jgi:GNAT superfamily N-acetyltransferase
MAHEFETGFHGEVQRRLRDLHPEIAADPALSNGGRVLNILDLDAVGWPRIRDYVERDSVVGLTAVPEAETRDKLVEIFGSDVSVTAWRVFFGDPVCVLPRVEEIVSNFNLPEGWRLLSVARPDDAMLDAIAILNLKTGVRPTPGYYLRGEVYPSTTTLLWDDRGTLAGCANATMRYHPQSRFVGTLFAGAVSVDPAHRGKGLGSLVNAALLRDAYRVHDWHRVIEQARDDNRASCGMLRRCGLQAAPDLVTLGVMLGTREFTR